MVEAVEQQTNSDSLKGSNPNPVSVQGRITGPTRRSTKGGWTEEEDKELIAAVKLFDGRNWRKIATRVPGRTDVQCLHRWQKVLDPDLVKGPWTKEEDDLILELVGKQGNRKWSEVAKRLPGRIGKQCRERWQNHLNPVIKKSKWTKEEEAILIKAHAIYGNKWVEISKFLQGRTENSIKNHWNSSLRKKLESHLALARELPNSYEVQIPTLKGRICEFSGRDYKSSDPPNIEYKESDGLKYPTGRTEKSSETVPDSYNPEYTWRSTLRKVANSFKHTPSIIRKRSSKTTTSDICSADNTSNLSNEKQLCLSPSKSRKLEASFATKSVEKRLEYEFNAEYD